MSRAMQAVLKAACLAPSGDNTQPWWFEVRGEQAVRIHLAEERDDSPMNAGQRMARIACGAALENMVRAARVQKWPAQVHLDIPGCLAEIAFSGAPGLPDVFDTLSQQRVTNRRRYERSPVPADVARRLVQATSSSTATAVETHWLVQPSKFRQFARAEAAAFKAIYGSGLMRRAMLDNIRFDLPSGERTETGMPMGSLEISRIEQKLLRMLGPMPDWLVKGSGALLGMARHVQKLIVSASGICVILARGESPSTDVEVGRAMQRAWLAMTEEGLAAQPMMATAVLHNLQLSEPEIAEKLVGTKRIEHILGMWPQILPASTESRPAFVLRFGYAPAPTARTGRRSDLLSQSEPKCLQVTSFSDRTLETVP